VCAKAISLRDLWPATVSDGGGGRGGGARVCVYVCVRMSLCGHGYDVVVTAAAAAPATDCGSACDCGPGAGCVRMHVGTHGYTPAACRFNTSTMAIPIRKASITQPGLRIHVWMVALCRFSDSGDITPSFTNTFGWTRYERPFGEGCSRLKGSAGGRKGSADGRDWSIGLDGTRSGVYAGNKGKGGYLYQHKVIDSAGQTGGVEGAVAHQIAGLHHVSARVPGLACAWEQGGTVGGIYAQRRRRLRVSECVRECYCVCVIVFVFVFV